MPIEQAPAVSGAGGATAAPESPPSLRDTLSANFDAARVEQPTETATAAPAASTTPKPTPADASAQTVAAPSASQTPAGASGDDRPRNPDGTFKAGGTTTAAAPATPAPRKPPSSWKRELDPHWNAIPKEVQDEIERRETDFIKGVSTYKGVADQLKPLADALAPFQDVIQNANIKPEQFVTALATTHRTLTTGAKEDKLRAFAKFAQDYQIPLHELLVQGEDGKVYLNQTYFQPQGAPPQQPAAQPQDVQKLVAQELAKVRLQEHIKGFIEAKDERGTPRYPHYKEVWSTMDRILASGLAPDLPSAYALALTLPQHSTLSTAQQEQQRKTDEVEKARQATEAAARARANAVSPRTSTPTELVVDKKATQQGIRAVLESAFDTHLGGGGRI